jgi:hypothetical protein
MRAVTLHARPSDDFDAKLAQTTAALTAAAAEIVAETRTVKVSERGAARMDNRTSGALLVEALAG